MRFGELIRPLRAGEKGLAVNRLSTPRSIKVRSDSFPDGGAMPSRFSVEGEGVAPGLSWAGVPAHAVELALVVQDVDVPLPKPIVHAVVHGIDPQVAGLAQGAWERTGSFGLNTMRKRAFLPPAPIRGHDMHRYVFQLFALSRKLSFAKPPSFSGLMAAMTGNAVACGVLIGTYERS